MRLDHLLSKEEMLSFVWNNPTKTDEMFSYVWNNPTKTEERSRGILLLSIVGLSSRGMFSLLGSKEPHPLDSLSEVVDVKVLGSHL